MLNRVFSNEAPIDLEIVEPAPLANTGVTPAGPRRAGLAPMPMAAAGLGTALLTVMVVGLWNQQQLTLRQERNLVLLERLRNLGPAAGAGATGLAGSGESEANASLPPPPPSEPWMEELAQLPADGAPAAEVLKVPFSAAIANRATTPLGPPPPVPGGTADGLPQLVGVVQSQGRGSSAIFQIGGSSSNAAVGETIGGSGWRLRATAGDSAVIERGGQVRRLSISSGF